MRVVVWMLPPAVGALEMPTVEPMPSVAPEFKVNVTPVPLPLITKAPQFRVAPLFTVQVLPAVLRVAFAPSVTPPLLLIVKLVRTVALVGISVPVVTGAEPV